MRIITMVLLHDLFGQIAITLDDVELYLNSLPNFDSHTSNSRRQRYADNYPLSTIIAGMKKDGRWESLETNANEKPSYVTTYQTKYVPTDSERILNEITVCPKNYHVCKNRLCKYYVRQLRRDRNARYQAKLKLKAFNQKKAEQRKARELLKIAA